MVKPPEPSQFMEGNYAPIFVEDSFGPNSLEIIGEVPRELNGSFYRNGPDPQFSPPGKYHWFDGDGMVHAFHFDDGQVRYGNRWVETRKFKEERKAGKALFGGLQDMFAGAWHTWFRPVNHRNTANTHIWAHAGKLLCLWEGGLPTAVDPHSLETEGFWNFSGTIKGKMTAHPKPDPETGQLLFFGASDFWKKTPTISYGEVGASGTVDRMETIEIPYHCMMHDFGTTRNYVVFPVFPTVADMARLRKKQPLFQWEPERGSHLGVMPRKGGPNDIIWFSLEACFVYHALNTWEEGEDLIHFDAVCYDGPRLVGAVEGEPPVPGLVARFTMNLKDKSIKRTTLDDRACEFPRHDDRRAGLPYKYGYVLGKTGERGMNPAFEADALFKYHMANGGGKEVHKLPDGAVPDEAVYVPKSPDSPEEAGYLLAIIYRPELDRSELIVVDTEAFEDPPVATVRLPRRIPFGFHANWRQA